MMCDVDDDLNFTMEISSDFNNSQISTLDFSLWMDMVDGKWQLLYEFYMKSMVSKYCEVENSARAWNYKAGGLSQEVVRRMLLTSEDLPLQVR